jgi:hypothetical protein
MHYKVNRKKIEHGADLFDLLVKMVCGQDQGTRDQRLLMAHLASKEKTGCR